jgi:PAS domain S-box-containing protein
MGKKRTARQARRPPAKRRRGHVPPSPAAAELERLHLQAQDAVGLQKLIADLQTYQEEARQQQEQLIEVQKYLEDSRDRFADLYDFAPIGYVTLDGFGVVEEINLTGTLLLGVERERLVGMPLMPHVVKEDRKAFLRHMLRCRAGDLRVTTELRVRPKMALPLHVHLTSRPGPLTANGRQTYRTAIVDVTEVKERDAELEEYRQRLRSLTSELATTEERERRRIATALHDNLGQVLALTRIKLGGLSKLLTPDLTRDGPAATTMQEVQQLVAEAIKQTRSLTLELSPPVLSLGLDAAVEWLAEQNRKHGLDVEFRSFLRSQRMPEEVKILLFQAVRELLNNVIKHAHAKHVSVTLRSVGGRVEAAVEDNGVGIKTADDPFLMRGDGFGLFSLRTRLEHLGGSLHITAASEGGTRVTVNVPTEHAAKHVKSDGDGAVSRARGDSGTSPWGGPSGSTVSEGVNPDAKPTTAQNHAGR